MRPIIMPSATKVLIVVFALILSFANFAEARDRNGDRHQIRRPHFERSHHDRQHRGRSQALTTINTNHHYRNDRRHGRDRFVGRMERRGHFERRYAHDRRLNRRVVREYRGQRGYDWAPSYGDDGFPSDANGGTYFGALSAWTDPGNGTYFNSDRGSYGYYTGDTDANYYSPRAKIIRVNPSTAGRACSWESGVCVIRR